MKKYIITSLLSLGLMASPLMATTIENKKDNSAFIASVIATVGSTAGFFATLPATLDTCRYIYYHGLPTGNDPFTFTFNFMTIANIIAFTGMLASAYAVYKTYPTNEESEETAQENSKNQTTKVTADEKVVYPELPQEEQAY